MDGSACYLCSGELDDSPSIDHIVAIARGGQDAVSNVALTHWDCNNKKRAKSLDETARLFPQMVLPMRMRDLYAKA
jgi:5-methylcytosine-specific restriction endonuclease McrA